LLQAFNRLLHTLAVATHGDAVPAGNVLLGDVPPAGDSKTPAVVGNSKRAMHGDAVSNQIHGDLVPVESAVLGDAPSYQLQ